MDEQYPGSIIGHEGRESVPGNTSDGVLDGQVRIVRRGVMSGQG